MRVYTVNTMKYTFGRALAVCACVAIPVLTLNLLCYKALPTVQPVWLDNLGVPASGIALVTATIPSILCFFLCPIISTLSDKTRSKYGRRLPYLFWSTPTMILLPICMAWSSEIGAAAAALFHVECTRSMEQLVLCIFIIAFQAIYLIPASIIYYLYADVIPKQWVGRFVAVMTVFGTLVTFVFNTFLLKYALDYSKLSFVVLGCLYGAAFVTMCLVVKEGSYPPVEDHIAGKLTERCADYITLYFRQGFRHKIFFFLFLTTALNQASTVCRNMFNLLFAVKELALTKEQFGEIIGWSSVVAAIIVIPVGRLMDAIRPIRIYFFGGLIVIAVNIWGYFFVSSYITFAVIGWMMTLVYAIQFLGNMPMLIELLPPDKFGQFASINSMINSLVMIVGSYLGGLCIEHFGYRFMFLWDAGVTTLASISLLIVFREWKRYGGPHAYRPPDTN